MANGGSRDAAATRGDAGPARASGDTRNLVRIWPMGVSCDEILVGICPIARSAFITAIPPGTSRKDQPSQHSCVKASIHRILAHNGHPASHVHTGCKAAQRPSCEAGGPPLPAGQSTGHGSISLATALASITAFTARTPLHRSQRSRCPRRMQTAGRLPNCWCKADVESKQPVHNIRVIHVGHGVRGIDVDNTLLNGNLILILHAGWAG